MRKPAWLRALSIAVALCAAAAAAHAAPACSATATHLSWADCAAVFANDDSVGSRGAAGTRAFDAAFSLVAVDGDGTALASFDFTTQGAISSQNSAVPGAVFATTAVAAIPEPHTNLLMLAGLAAIGFMATRRRRQ